MDEAQRQADALGAALLVHHAGGVGRDDVLGAGLGVVPDLVVAHLRRHTGLEHTEGPAEVTAFIPPGRLDKLDALDLFQELERLRIEGLVGLGRLSQTEAAQRIAVVVNTDLVRELRPGKRVDLEDVVQELRQLEGP